MIIFKQLLTVNPSLYNCLISNVSDVIIDFKFSDIDFLLSSLANASSNETNTLPNNILFLSSVINREFFEIKELLMPYTLQRNSLIILLPIPCLVLPMYSAVLFLLP